jgi:Kef-type K+ transport system membrane component KefB
MPVFLFARHAAWLACGVYGAFSLPATVALIASLLREGRRQKKARGPVVLAPLTLKGLAAGGVIALAGGEVTTGTLSLISASLAVVSALLVRLNWRLIETNNALLQENARLLAASVEHTDSRPHP